jgi:hypothetical protein
MKRILKVKIQRLVLFLGLLVMLPNIGITQVTFKAEAPNIVSVNEYFNLRLTFNTSGSITSKPVFSPGFQELGTRRETEISQSGSKIEQVHTISFTLQPLQEGKFTIGAATVVDENGKTYTSNPVTIEVIKGQAQQQTQSASNSQNSSNNDALTDIYIRLIPSRTSLYRGDNLTLTLKVYCNANMVGSSTFKLPAFDGFWTKEIDLQGQTWQRENVDGKIYNTQVIKSWTLSPQKSGALKIEPAEITWIIRKVIGRRSLFVEDYEDIKKLTKTPVITINVKDMPSGAPNSFTGAVGNFTMTAKLSKDNVTANDAISLNVKISGNGNFSLIGTPKLTFPQDFEVFDSRKTQTANSVNFEYPMVPRSAGTFTIEPVAFSYFEPSAGKYVSLISNPMVIVVEKDANSPQQVAFTNPTNQRNVSILVSDVRFIKNQAPAWQAKGSCFLGFKHFYPLYIFAVILFLFAYFVLHKRHKDSQNIILMRNRKAKNIARKRLKIAEKSMKLNNAANFYDELLKAIWGYLGDKFTLPVAELSRNNISELLSKRGVEQKDIDKLISIVDECEYARYAPGANSLQIHSLYNNTIEIMSKLEQKTK